MISAVIPCSGEGSRMKKHNKLLHEVKGHPIIKYTLDPFQKNDLITEIVLVIKESDRKYYKRFVNDKVKLTIGADTRLKSVYNGVQSTCNALVIIHDGARPNLSCGILNECVEYLRKNEAVAVAKPMTDTIQEYYNGTFKVVDRKNKYTMQTPQGASREILLKVMKTAIAENFIATDEVSILSKYSDAKINLVNGCSMNLKITYEEDLELFESLRQ